MEVQRMKEKQREIVRTLTAELSPELTQKLHVSGRLVRCCTPLPSILIRCGLSQASQAASCVSQR
jgi:hypothetical protein